MQVEMVTMHVQVALQDNIDKFQKWHDETTIQDHKEWWAKRVKENQEALELFPEIYYK